MQMLIMSDIHGNVSALNSVLSDVKARFHPDALVLLGDYIDYGMRPNEVISILKAVQIPVVCSIWGNHENAVLTGDDTHFSTKRGILSAKRTRELLSEESSAYLNSLSGKDGHFEFLYAGKKFLGVHGSLENYFWGCIKPERILPEYAEFDYVLSGHTHCAHAFSQFYELQNEGYRNKKRTFFMNPGSVGQPRNHDPHAQYAVLDMDGGIYLCGVDYDIPYEQSLYTEDVDEFYMKRLVLGV